MFQAKLTVTSRLVLHTSRLIDSLDTHKSALSRLMLDTSRLRQIRYFLIGFGFNPISHPYPSRGNPFKTSSNPFSSLILSFSQIPSSLLLLQKAMEAMEKFHEPKLRFL